MPKRFPGSPYDASNASRSGPLFIKRNIYRLFAYESADNLDSKLPPPVKDFWRQENYLYGRVNEQYTPMMCSEPNLVEIEPGVRVMDFVALAYEQMKKEYQLAQQAGRFPVELPTLSTCVAQRGYISPRGMYKNISTMLGGTILKIAASREDVMRETISLEKFIPFFMRFVKTQAMGFPLTFSSFVMGGYGYTMQTGLAFEIADFPHDADEAKIKDFIANPYFSFYKTVALKYGFSIDMNAPWRLVADLGSPRMQQFMALTMGSGKMGPTKYFNTRASPAFTVDIEKLKTLAIRTYNSLCASRPRVKTYQLRNGKLEPHTLFRKPSNRQEMDQLFSFDQWLKFYIELKNIEKGGIFPETRLKHIFNNSQNLANSLDKQRAIGYINRNFDEIRSVNGSLNYSLYKKFFNEMKPENWPFVDFETYYKQAVALSTYQRY